MTALVANLPGLNVKNSPEFRQSLPTVRSRHSDQPQRFSESTKELDFCSDSVSNGHHKSRNKHKSQGMHSARSTASLDMKEIQLQAQRRRPSRIEVAMENLQKSRKSSQSMEFDSEPTYYRMQVI